MITDCGELSAEDASGSDARIVDSTGDAYEDFPEDADKPAGGDAFTATEILKIASDLKGYGNTAFKASNFTLALDKYQKGIRYLDEDPELKDASDETKKELARVCFSLNSNGALMANKLQSWEESQRLASAALRVDGIEGKERAKALFRRALASVQLKDDESALADLTEAKSLTPDDGLVKKEYDVVKKRTTEKQKKEKAAYQKFFT